MDDDKRISIIGISGKYGSGKDTIAAMIMDLMPGIYTKESFAYNVKLVSSILTGTTLEEQFTREGKSKIPEGFDQTLGRYQQIVGAGMRDIINDKVWILSILNKKHSMIISDVRYKNEAEAIEEAGGIVIRVDRPICESCVDENGNDYCNGRDPNHPSETDLDNYNFKCNIVNGGDLKDLKRSVIDALTFYNFDFVSL
jgi:hypothetical protein